MTKEIRVAADQDADALQALREFERAASRLSELWVSEDWLELGYPRYMPSFDELANDVARWLGGAERQLRAEKRNPRTAFEDALVAERVAKR